MRRSNSIAANPILIGAATTLVIIVAVFLSYNANNGLPFVPTYQLYVDVPSAANLTAGNDVRLGGTRVGVVDKITARHASGTSGRVYARLHVKLETVVKPLPVDSTVLIRSKSALGLKYLELTKGRSTKGFDDGAVVPLGRATPAPVEFDEALSAFDTKTRANIQRQLTGLGDGLAGRGEDLHTGVTALDPLLRTLTPVMANLASPRTDLDGLLTSLGRTSAQLAPVAEDQASLLRNLDTTFSALASVAKPYLQDSISGAPPALQTATSELPKQRPFLADTTQLFAALRPGVSALSDSADDLADAVTVGPGALTRSVTLSRRLKPVFTTLEDFAKDPLDQLGVKDLGQTAKIAGPLFSYITPAQTTCNYVTLLLRNGASNLSVGDSVGTAQRFQLVVPGEGPNNESSPAAAPANGGGPTPNTNYLHTNPYPNTAAPGQTQECEAGNEDKVSGTKFPIKQVIGNVPGNQTLNTEKTKASVGG